MGDEISIVVNEGNEGSTSTGMHSWVVEINDKLSKMEKSPETDPLMKKNSAIYRRPANVREEKDSNYLYTPRIVSFGPYHHDHECCQQTNKIKQLVLLHCLKSSGKGIDDYVGALREDAKNLKEAYTKLEPKWEQDDDAFLQLMIFDGCFLLHILHEGNHIGHLSHELLTVYEISSSQLIEYYKHDMLLLENQLPMQLLEKLLALQNDSLIEEAQGGLYKLILGFIAPSSRNIAENLPRQKGQIMYLHVLDLYRLNLLLYHDQHEGKSGSQHHKRYLPLKETFTSNSIYRSTILMLILMLLFYILFYLVCLIILPITIIVFIILGLLWAIRYFIYFVHKMGPVEDVDFLIPSATELHKVGIRLLMKRTKSLENISFEGEVLKLQQIYVDGATKSRLLNIIAFEQLHTNAKNVVTSYIYFMSRLLLAAGDVRLLQLHEIICTMLHKDEVVELFKSLTNDINVQDPNILLNENCRDVGKRMSWWFHEKSRNYLVNLGCWQTSNLRNPWAFISIVAAIFLFSFTAVQTVYTILSYYNFK